jgi:hypothetical protein
LKQILKKLLVFGYNSTKHKVFRKKRKEILRQIKGKPYFRKTPVPIIKAYSDLWKPLHSSPSRDYLDIYTSITGKLSEKYIPEDLYYKTVEPVLNDYSFNQGYTDKINYGRVLTAEYLIKNIVSGIENSYFDSNMSFLGQDYESIIATLKPHNDIFIKPAQDSGGGYNIHRFIRNEDSFITSSGIELNNEFLKNTMTRNFVIQPKISGHPFFTRFNPSSLNTVRILTYRSIQNNTVSVLHAILRIGNKGSIVDNQASGGISVGINREGQLNSYGIDKLGNVYTNFNNINFAEQDPVIRFSELCEIACKEAKNIPYARLIGWDFAVTADNEIKIIEFNTKNNEINFYQMNNGPLFGNFTSEVITYAAKRPKSFVLDFYI